MNIDPEAMRLLLLEAEVERRALVRERERKLDEARSADADRARVEPDGDRRR